MEQKLISIVAACYNEEENIDELYRQVMAVMEGFRGRYACELIFIDNASVDGTVKKVKALAAKDKAVRLIVNTRNFGHLRSPYYAFLQTKGDAVVNISSDLQTPPAMIGDFIRKWEEGFKIVIGVKAHSKENALMRLVRKTYYHLITSASETEQIHNFTGFGLYDKQFVDTLRGLDIAYPYFRGLVSDLGFNRAEIPFTEPRREKGKTKNNFYTLYDLAMLGFVSHSKLPLRLASFFGFGVSFLSFLSGLGYLIYKIINWNTFQVGMAPMVIGMFFIGGVQLFFMGVIGEYVGSIHTQVHKRPLVVEKERVNF